MSIQFGTREEELKDAIKIAKDKLKELTEKNELSKKTMRRLKDENTQLKSQRDSLAKVL